MLVESSLMAKAFHAGVTMDVDRVKTRMVRFKPIALFTSRNIILKSRTHSIANIYICVTQGGSFKFQQELALPVLSRSRIRSLILTMI